MSFDDELRARMQEAAQRAGSDADAAAAAAKVTARIAAGDAAPSVGLKIVGSLGVAGLVVGGVLGATALRPGPVDAVTAPGIDTSSGALWDCPDGSIVSHLRAGDRVLVVGRDDSGDWSAIRDPRSIAQVVWVPGVALDPDADSPPEVPVIECAEGSVSGEPIVDVTTTAPESTTTSTTTTTTTPASTTTVPGSTTSVPRPVPTTVAPAPAPAPTVPPVVTTAPAPTTPPTPTVAPTTAPPTTVPPDTQRPTVQAGAAPGEIYDASWAAANCPSVATLTAFASDTVGVTSVTGTYTGLPGSPLTFVRLGGEWRANFGPFSGLSGSFNQVVTITITARDAAGNTASTNASVRVWGTCLI